MIASARKDFLMQYIVQIHYERVGVKTTVCCLTAYNGYEVVGTSAPLRVENFNEELGRQFAFNDALRHFDNRFAFLQHDRDYMEEHGDEEK